MTDDHVFPDREHAAERYLLGEMSDADRERYEEHFFGCAECAEDVRTTAAFMGDVRTYVAPDASARPVAMAPVASLRPSKPAAAWYRSPVVAWAMAASVLMFSGYQSLVVVPGLRSQVSPHGLSPITLRPESRGQEPEVRAATASDGFTLAIEINDVQEGTLMEYKIATVDGRRPTSGRLAAPRAGTPLLLWLPSATLEEPTRYELSIQDSATGRLLGTYRFVRSQ